MRDAIFDKKYSEDLINGGTTCCPGCGGPLFWRMAAEVLGPKTIVYGDGPCAMCALRSLKLPFFTIHFSFIADGSSGILAALRAQGRDDITVVSSGGDGASADISFGKISAAAERNENMIQVCIDNEAYMNTGIQKSGATPYGAWTTTTPLGKETIKKDLPMILAQHKVSYVSTASVAYPRDLKTKIAKAKEVNGFKYIHTVMPCPTGWRFDPSKSIEITRLGVETWIFPLYEIENGILKITLKPKQKPVEEYLKAQNRFKHLTEEQITYIQKQVDLYKKWLLEHEGQQIVPYF